MDNRTLVAFGMLLALVAFALQKHAVDGNAVEKIVIFLSGSVSGVMTQRQPNDMPKPAARAAAVALLIIGAALFLHGCATTEPYTGPVGPPELTGTEWVWPHGIDGRLRRETVLHVANRTERPLDGFLDCDPPGHGSRARNWPGTRLTLHIPPMTIQHVLLDPHDHLCSLLPIDGDGQR